MAKTPEKTKAVSKKKAFEVDESVSIGKFDLTDKTRIRCRLNRKGEDISVDLRVWYTTDKSDGEYMPTQKGVSTDVDNIDKIIRMLEKAKTKSEAMKNGD